MNGALPLRSSVGDEVSGWAAWNERASEFGLQDIEPLVADAGINHHFDTFGGCAFSLPFQLGDFIAHSPNQAFAR